MIGEADRLVASLLAGRASADAVQDAGVQDSLLDAAIEHDVDVLLREVLKTLGAWPTVSPPVKAALDTQARHQAVRDVLRTRELARVLRAFRCAGPPALVIKGAAIAHTHYTASYLRPRYDTDLLVHQDDVGRASALLEGLGYARVVSVSRDAIRTQRTFERRLGQGVPEYVDLHWAISNRPLFAGMLTVGELMEDAVRVTNRGNDGLEMLTPCPVHALLLACIHRIAHHNGWPRLVWLYDIRLLAEGLAEAEWERFWTLANERGLVALCGEALDLTEATVGVRTDPSANRSRPTTCLPGSGDRREPSSAYLGGVGTRWRSLALDLAALRGPIPKLRLLASHAFPDAAYMRAASGAKSPLGLAAAYLRRLAAGLGRMGRTVRNQV